MAEVGHREKLNKIALVGSTLLLVCMFIPTTSETCPDGDYLTNDGICCNKCSRGFKLVEKCHATGQRSNCTQCPAGQFMDQLNFFPNCRRCKVCKASKNEHVTSPCVPHQNTICQCNEGYYKANIDSEIYECHKCTRCELDEKEKQKCTPLKNTVCECSENYYRVNNKCQPCKNCSTECQHLCPSVSTAGSPKGPDSRTAFLTNIIAGVVTVALLLLVIVVLITYMTTKRFTEKKLIKPPSKPSDDSLDSSEILISYEEHLHNTSVYAIPQSPVSEQQPSNLPDCVLVEINIADLIYTVLDLVPVVHVKQLVRTLGVKDIEIEQAEMDHKTCREAHYQMLRVWAERGSRGGGGGGGRGGVPHWPLLQELSHKLRTMGLGGLAEELETKYGVQ